MIVTLFFNRMRQTEEFPKSVLKLQDILDRCQMPPNDYDVQFEIPSYRLEQPMSYRLTDRAFTADIYRLNLFAERYEQMSNAEKAVFSAVADRYKPENFEDVLALTYSLDTVPAIPCETFEDVGRFCIQLDMLTEIEHCPEKLLAYLDKDKIGRTRSERYGGILRDGYYCEPELYQKLDIKIKIKKPEKEIFRVLIGPAGEDGKKQAQWISLPTYYENIAEIGDCYGFESAVPNLTEDVLGGMKYIHDLNAFAGWLADFDRTDFIKFKAVMQAENICSLDGAEALLDRIDEYEFDPVPDASEFGERYLAKNLPEAFDIYSFIGVDLTGFGEAILRHKNGSMTDYGAVVHGQKLYAKITPEEEPEEELTEDDSPNWGGMM